MRVVYGMKAARDNLFDRDLLEIKRCQVLVALLDGPDIDSGTAVEMGIAHALGVPVVGLKTDFYRRNRIVNNMIWGVCGRGATLVFDLKHLLKKVRTIAKGGSRGRERG